jgi:hypothetical protein
MKQTTLLTLLATAMGCTLGVAQTTTTTSSTNPVTGTTTTQQTTTSSAGTISSYSPGTDYVTFRGATDTAPVRYYYDKSTTIVDPAGHTVAWTDVRPDMPATFYYDRIGDRTVVRRIVLSQPVVMEKETTTTTTTTTERH